jgi:hypothetical protein
MQAPFRNQGGFNIIGSGRDKIESAEQLAAAAATVRRQPLHMIVVLWSPCISNTQAQQPGAIQSNPAAYTIRQLLRCVPCRRVCNTGQGSCCSTCSCLR